MKRYFCTYFDHNYLVYGMTLFDSLVRSGIDFKLYVLCLSDESYRRLEFADPRIIAIKLNDLESFDTEFAACKENRSKIEYIFTASPCFPLFLFQKFPEIDLLAYLDSDLYFYQSPEILFEELGDKSLYIIEHRFAPEFSERSAMNGRFNMAFQIYRRNETAVKCLEKWRKQCIEWCYDRVEDGKFADQKYLDSWPDDWKDEVVISQNYGANLAPWNIDNFEIKENKDYFTIREMPLVFVHYQGFKILSKNIFIWYAWTRKQKNRIFFKKFAYQYFYRAMQCRKKYPEIFADIENLYPNRGAFYSPKLEKLLYFIPGKHIRQFLRILYVMMFYRKNIFFTLCSRQG